ncbi:hypothetical protein [Streptomyces sp. B3I8]|uniref:hypothetical protein n=1 Tax=Streptomyces sp. B3I8 TaxID=3042303 RepID=UPI002783E956|nr:hypothetical protein [Streptomyces sp. B3I8]MDQ0786567.1 hypothetical protein [Streptomyces sp. B3I8]
MQSQDVAPRPATIDVTAAEAALVEHYPRLTRLAYLTLPATLGRNRRVLTAHSLVQRALPHGRTPAPPAVIPAQSKGRESDPGYALVRTRVIRTALDAARPLTFRAWPRRAQLPPLLPQVRGLALSPRSGGADENALDQALSALSAPARAAYVLRGLDRLPDDALREVLAAAGVADPDGALAEAATVPARELLFGSREFDPCTLHARPTDLMRRRRHARAALVAAAAVAVCGALLALPGGGWGPDGAAAPAYARNPSAAAALDPGRLTKAAATAWRTSPRTDFSVWPARGDDVDDTALLRRALAVWARPGESVRVAVTPGTPSGGPAGPPQLLYAGEVDSARVVLLYDGLRIVRYAEPVSGTAGAAVDFARVDGAGRAEAVAVVLGRADGNVRYLTAPWIERAGERDLRKPAAGVMDLHRRADGTVSPLSSPAAHPGSCTSWNVLQLTDRSGGTRLMTDLGELTPAHLTVGRPAAPREAAGAAALRTWAPFACSLAADRAQGVRTVNAWQYARQPLPDGSGDGAWVCTRAETWRGEDVQVLAQFRAPSSPYGAVTAKAQDDPACGPKDPHVLAGVLWKSDADAWYLLAAADRAAVTVRATGSVRGEAEGHTLSLPAKPDAETELTATLENGNTLDHLR